MASALTSAPTAPAGPNDGARKTLDWEAFSARNFPGRPRHDLEAIAAYAAYRRLQDTLAAASTQQQTALA